MGVQDNYQSEAIHSITEGQVFSNAQQWIIGIIAFAVIVTLLATIIIYCQYRITNKPNKIIKVFIIIFGIIVAITFIIIGIVACNSIN